MSVAPRQQPGSFNSIRDGRFNPDLVEKGALVSGQPDARYIICGKAIRRCIEVLDHVVEVCLRVAEKKFAAVCLYLGWRRIVRKVMFSCYVSCEIVQCPSCAWVTGI